ncbi:hypothetical protein [Saccharopolyspora rosea]|uniref:Small secreted domain DUF320 n=1 Tax=Saccharopolyspora rosea TaxID=524884 RepID=A0ABW3FNF6_9PSEU|nr:hypothetical protein [Saccharopolyspora rosea]
MLKKAAIIGGAAAGLMALAPVANADTADNDGINAVDDNNVSVLPIQACNDDVAAAIGVIVPVASPQTGDCVNAPVVDHPSA